MDALSLDGQSADQVSFCCGVDHQHLLVNGTPDEVQAKVRESTELVPTGLIVSPNHEVTLPDIAPANIAAMLQATRA